MCKSIVSNSEFFHAVSKGHTLVSRLSCAPRSRVFADGKADLSIPPRSKERVLALPSAVHVLRRFVLCNTQVATFGGIQFGNEVSVRLSGRMRRSLKPPEIRGKKQQKG